MEISKNIQETRGWVERTAKEHGFGTTKQLLDYLSGKKVIDLGSGEGGFATDIYAIQSVAPEYNIEVYSINPRLNNGPNDPDYEIGFMDYSSIGISNIGFSHSINLIKHGREIYRNSAIAASWYSIPFPDNSIDLILATGSYMFYEGTYDNDSFLEIMRVLKNDGEFRASMFLRPEVSLQYWYDIFDEIKKLGFSIEYSIFAKTELSESNDPKTHHYGYIVIRKELQKNSGWSSDLPEE